MSKNNYKYIWGTDKNKSFKISNKISPYLEINEDSINEKLNKEIISVNPYLRFFHIFFPYIDFIKDNKNSKYYKLQKSFENKSLNFLKKLDYIRGMTPIDVYCEKIMEDFYRGVYGDELREMFGAISEENRKKLLLLMCNKIINRESEFSSFFLILNYFFKGNIVYKYRKNSKKIIIYINCKKNKENIFKIKIIKKIFLPIKYDLLIYWKDHFGVLNVEDIMLVDKMGVF